ncbi:FAA hydrolase family protein [Sinorhizobium meliloti]|nr:FAA hydrolase family protein [Sinorhizobium meliloti]
MRQPWTPRPSSCCRIRQLRRVFRCAGVYCVGRNYRPTPARGSRPRPWSALLLSRKRDESSAAGRGFPYPKRSSDVHHELSWSSPCAPGGAGHSRRAAADQHFGYAVGIDFTRRDLQAEAKEGRQAVYGRKGVRAFAPGSAIVPVTATVIPQAAIYGLKVNGELRHRATSTNDLGRCPRSSPSFPRLFTLAPGDDHHDRKRVRCGCRHARRCRSLRHRRDRRDLRQHRLRNGRAKITAFDQGTQPPCRFTL